MEWIGLTMLRLYDATQDKCYLETAQRLWRFVKYGWDEVYVDGGISWREDQPWSKNACSNGPGSLFASRMYRVTRDEADKEWAVKIYKWEREHLFNPETGAIADNIDGRSMRKAGFNLSYNQGLFLGAAHELYQLTGEKSYLEDAQLAALFTITARQTLDRRNGILRDEGKDDGGLFKGIFMRYFVLLMLDSHIKPENLKQFREFLYHNADVLWNRGRDRERCLFGSSWAAVPEGSVTLTCQTSAVMFLEAVAFYERSLAAKKGSGDSKVEK
ncbi:MAG: glycosyl hydrolase family 76, partial [Verrucomicrobia bacterium]|nr:glycosyl hydrolase family 76 [Verrucomicrobiota bacterium]